MPDEAEVTHLPALAKGSGTLEVDVVEVPVVDDVTAAERRVGTFQQVPLAESILVQAIQRFEMVILLGVFGGPDVLPALAGTVLEAKRYDYAHHAHEKQPGHKEIDKAEPESGPTRVLESHSA